MKTFLSIIATLLFSTLTFAQIGSGLQYKSGLKKMEFEPVTYEVYGQTIESMRLSEKSANSLKTTKVDQLSKLGTQINTVEKELDKVRTKLIELDYPLRTMAEEWITKLEKLEKLDVTEKYKKEIASYRKLYVAKVEDLKSNGQLDSLMYAKDRHGI